jgi:PKD repeat protein
MSTDVKEAPKPSVIKGWVKMILGTAGGLLGGALMMHINPWIDKAIKPDKPLANFAVEHHGLTVTFVNRSSGGSEGRWDFGDGSPIEIVPAKQETVTHTYSKAGTYSVKLALRNLLDEVNERSVNVDLTETQQQKPVDKPEIMDLYVKSPGKVGEPIYAPATFQFVATADNAQMYIWDFGDGKGIQMGEDHASYTFTQPGSYPVKVTVFNGKLKTVKDAVVQVAAPPTGTLAVNVKVADQGLQVETRRREVPVSGAATIGGTKNPTVIEQTIAASPGCEIMNVERVSSQNQNIESTSVQIAADRKTAKITAKLAKLSGVNRAILYESYAVQEQRKEKATREPIPLMATVGAPGNTTVRLPAIPGDWTDVKRAFVFELRQDGRVLWQGNDLPKNVPVNLNGQTYMLAANLAGDRVQINMVGRN